MPYYYMKEIKWNPLRLIRIKFYKETKEKDQKLSLFVKVRNRRKKKIC